MRKYREQWQKAAAAVIKDLLQQSGAAGAEIPMPTPETPPSPELGDISFPMFPFAKALRMAPAAIAKNVAAGLYSSGTAGGEVKADGPYVNVRLTRTQVIEDILTAVRTEGERFGVLTELAGKRIVVEFSCPNTNKPLHLGHLRNDALGECLSRILALAGAEVRKVNLINDRGVHICKSMLAYKLFGSSTTPQSEGVKGDHFVGNFYVKYASHAEKDPQAAEDQVRDYLRKWE
jgi:arginyl-tRNA synthetase